MSANARTPILVLSVIIASVFFISAQPSQDSLGTTRDFTEDLSFDPAFYRGDEWITDDRSGDGLIDYALKLDDDMEKALEAADYDKDGAMDDFYFYRNGVLYRQEIDQNNDGRIDLWIYLSEGVYVTGYERDSDFDGVIDSVKIFGEQDKK